ncbi:MAG: SGNH/GDSL hydrolase family protein [Planctomycetes bacterium]|nr:SGNH/GDSL hydrolase family protein [Planctomycetota bacterium]
MREPPQPLDRAERRSDAAQLSAVAKSPRRLSRKKKFAFITFIFVVMFGVPELAVRIFAPQYAHLRTGKYVTGGYRIGGRGAEHGQYQISEPKAPGEIRFAMLGDSVMWGYGLPEDGTIPSLVESKLRTARSDILWRCVNMGGMGTTPAYRRDFFVENLAKWPIDGVIYQFHLNDVANKLDHMTAPITPGIRGLFENQGRVLRSQYLSYSGLFGFINHKAHLLKYAFHDPIDPATHGMVTVASCDSEEIRDRWDKQFQAMADLKAVCDRRGITFRVYLYPIAEHLSDHPSDNPRNFDRSKFTVDAYARFEAYLEKYGLSGRHLLDPVKKLRQAMLAGEIEYDWLYFPQDTNHPNQRGAHIFADAIVADILDSM